MSAVARRVERLSGMDAWQLYQETRLQVGNGVAVAVVDRTALTTSLYDHVVTTLASRIHLVPAYRKVLYSPWFNPDRPMLASVAEVDVAEHVTTVPMPSPGGLAGVEQVLARVRATHLDPTKPLWHTYVIDDGATAPGNGDRYDDEYGYVITVVHHMLVDGESAMETTGYMLMPGDLSSLPARFPPQESTFPDRPSAILADAARRKAQRLRRLPALIALSRRTLRAERDTKHLQVKAPRTVFNCTLSGTSTTALATLPLDDLRRVGEHFDVTINHILLSCVAAALRRALQERGATVSAPLVAAVPYAMRDADSSDYITEGVGTTTVLRVNLNDDIADPVERLQAIADHARAVKEVKERRGVNLFRQWNEYAPGRLVTALFRLIERFGLAERISWPCNVIVSNASGFVADDPTFLNLPAPRFYPAGPLYHGMGPSVLAITWMNNLCLSMTADRRHVADAAALTAVIDEEFATLVARTGGAAG